MAPITLWGPATWDFFHTAASKIKPEHFRQVAPQLFAFIVRICNNLPCPSCSQHARQYISKLLRNQSFLSNKQLFINALYIFHNEVNKRNQKRMYLVQDLEKYKNYNLINTFNKFSQHFHSDGSIALITENFHRRRLVTEVKKWLIPNLSKFEN